jgi:histone deacetylase 6
LCKLQTNLSQHIMDEDITMRDLGEEEVLVGSSTTPLLPQSSAPEVSITEVDEMQPSTGLLSPQQELDQAPELDVIPSIKNQEESEGLGMNGESSATSTSTSTEAAPHKLSMIEAASNALMPSDFNSASQSMSERGSSISDDDLILQNPPRVTIEIKQPGRDARLPYSSSKTGLVYDPRMRFHMEVGSTTNKDSDDDDLHPEDPRRIWSIYNELQLAGLTEEYSSTDEEAMAAKYYPQRLERIAARFAEPNEICLVHSKEHYNWVAGLKYLKEDELKRQSSKLDSVYLNSLTHFCAMLAAGGAIEATRAVVSGRVKNAIAVIRPPGHHAEHGSPGGFCFFNNVCVAARVCQNDFPDICRKVLILDWDVHHGNGIQNIFESDPNVLYISVHVHKDGQFYPQGPAGNHKQVGIGNGIGKNVNIPWPQHWMGDGDYLHAFQRVVMPIAQEFNPDLVIIAAGFDAAEGDTLGQCRVTPNGFSHMTHMLMSLADGKVVACLEGGYNLRSIAKCALSVTKTLMGEAPSRLYDVEPSLSAVATVQTVISEQAKYWKCLYPKENPGARLERMDQGIRLDTALRDLQAESYWDQFKMSRLFVNTPSGHPDHLTKSLVLGSSDYTEKPVLFIIHDSPEIFNRDDAPVTKLRAGTILTKDLSEPFIRHARESGYAVIDIFIPTDLAVKDGDKDGSARTAAFNEVASYVWLNYFEAVNSRDCVLMGIGAASEFVLFLLNAHGMLIILKGNMTNLYADKTSDLVKQTILLISDQTVPSANRATDDYFASWYYNHSMVFVSQENSIWAADRGRKPKKRLGNIIKSEAVVLTDMLEIHEQAIFDKISEMLGGEWHDDMNESSATLKDGHEGLALEVPLANENTAIEDVVMNESFEPTTPISPRQVTPSHSAMQSPSRMPPMGTFVNNRTPPVGTFFVTPTTPNRES